MAEYKINKQCIVGRPSCDHGFNSTRMCFIARPADGEFQLEEDILKTVLTSRSYETYVAMSESDPGRFAFCTKICSKIITSHFCIAILNPSKHASEPKILIPNPNVHLEYGMMMAFHKHIIPMQKSSDILPFNIYPIDTIKYEPQTFKKKAEDAIDEVLLRFKAKETPAKQTPLNMLKYYIFKGLRYSDIAAGSAGQAVYNLGGVLGFNLLDGGGGNFVFVGYFVEDEPRDSMVAVKYLIKNIADAYKRIQAIKEKPEYETAQKVLNNICIEMIVPENAPVSQMTEKAENFQHDVRKISLTFIRPSEIDQAIQQEYESIGF